MLVSIVKSTVRCKKCSLRLILENYPQHLKNRKHVVSCEWCNECYYSMCDLSRHVFGIHQEEQDIFEQQHGQRGEGEGEDLIEMGEIIDNVCNNCGECFGTAENLKEHVPKCSNEESNMQINGNGCKTEAEDSEIIDLTGIVKQEHEKSYTCVSCRDSFNLFTLVEHIKSEHAEANVAMIPCSICGVVFMQTNTLFEHLDEHLRTGTDKYIGMSHQCCVCFKNFHELEALPVHMRLHKAKKMVCPVCPRRLKDEISLKQHLLVLHTELEYCCPRCDMTFNNYSSMILHQDSHSTSGSRYCIRCNRNFSSSLDFQKHMKQHGKATLPPLSVENDKRDKRKEQRPFGCVRCKQCFKSAQALSVHSITHESKNRCKECGIRLPTEKEKEDHIRYCKPRECICAECGKKMRSQRNLKRHIQNVHLASKH